MFRGRPWPFLFIFFLFVAQNFMNYLMAGNIPPVVLISVVYYSLKHGWRSGLWLGLFAGGLHEIFGQGPLGFYMAQFAAVGVLSGFLSSRIFGDSLLTEILLPTLAVYFSSLCEIFYVQWMAQDPSPWRNLSLAFRPGTLFITALFSPLLFYCLRKTSSRNPWRS